MKTITSRRAVCCTLAASLALGAFPIAVLAADLDGSWTANGYRYTFALNESYGGRISVRNPMGTVARGVRNGLRLEMMSQDGTSTPWNGTITSLRGGIPVEIRMSNGTVLRKIGFLQPVASVDPPEFARGNATSAPVETGPVPSPVTIYSVVGVYSSNLGLIYRLSQEGNTFSWTVDGLAQTGQGTIAGNRVQASWQGPLSRGASGGSLVLGRYGPEGIRFDNGVVLTLQQ